MEETEGKEGVHKTKKKKKKQVLMEVGTKE